MQAGDNLINLVPTCTVMYNYSASVVTCSIPAIVSIEVCILSALSQKHKLITVYYKGDYICMFKQQLTMWPN